MNLAKFLEGQRRLAFPHCLAFARGLALMGGFAFPRCLTFTDGLALRCYLASIAGIAFPAPAPGRLAIIGIRLVTVIVTIVPARFLPGLSARLLTIFAGLLLMEFLAWFPSIVVSPAVIIVFGIVVSEPHLLAVFRIARPDDAVEPFSDRHAGLTRGGAGGFARFWTEAS
jgi:hypothetical protein